MKGVINLYCPNCEAKTKVFDSRSIYEATYRRRRCLTCGYVFTTEELESESDGIRDIWSHTKAEQRKERKQ